MVWHTENVMGLVVDPAALGGLAGVIALASWAVGRMQGDAMGKRQKPAATEFAAPRKLPDCAPVLAPAPAQSAAATAPQGAAAGLTCQQRASAERRALLANPVALAELHAEASAIRRDERIFESAAHSEAMIALPQAVYERECRYLGLSGQPTCPDAARHACDAGEGCNADVMGAAGMIQSHPIRRRGSAFG